jgi:hypothetical protein
MESPLVVESEIGSQASLQGTKVFMSMEEYLFILDGPPEPLYVYIVLPATTAIHAYPHMVFMQYLGECVRRELASLVGVENCRSTVRRQGFPQSFFAEPGVHAVGDLPGKHLAAVYVQYRRKVYISGTGQLDICQVCAPCLVGVTDFLVPEQVRIYRVQGMFHTRISFCMQGFDMQDIPDQPDLLHGKQDVLPLHLQGDLAVAVVGMLNRDAPDFRMVLSMQWLAWFPLVVQTASADANQQALPSDGQPCIPAVDQSGSLPYSCLYFFFSHSFS